MALTFAIDPLVLAGSCEKSGERLLSLCNGCGSTVVWRNRAVGLDCAVGYKRYSKKSEKVVEWNNIVKGYEHEKGQYVVMSDEDFKRANVNASRTNEILIFVADVDTTPAFFEAPYYVFPGKHSENVCALLKACALIFLT